MMGFSMLNIILNNKAAKWTIVHDLYPNWCRQNHDIKISYLYPINMQL